MKQRVEWSQINKSKYLNVLSIKSGEHHEDIAEWYNSNIKSRLTKAFRKDTARKSEPLVDKELDEHNVIDIEEYRNNISIDNEKSVYSR